MHNSFSTSCPMCIFFLKQSDLQYSPKLLELISNYIKHLGHIYRHILVLFHFFPHFQSNFLRKRFILHCERSLSELRTELTHPLINYQTSQSRSIRECGIYEIHLETMHLQKVFSLNNLCHILSYSSVSVVYCGIPPMTEEFFQCFHFWTS